MVNGADTAETDSDTEAAQEVAQEALGLGGENFGAGAGSAALQVRSNAATGHPECALFRMLRAMTLEKGLPASDPSILAWTCHLISHLAACLGDQCAVACCRAAD